MNEAQQEDISAYEHFNDFFTRSLKDGLRPISDSKIISPVDGLVSQCGSIDESMIVQAKGKSYSVSALLSDKS